MMDIDRSIKLTILFFVGLIISCGKIHKPLSPQTASGSAYPNICETDKGFMMIWYEGDKNIVMSEFTEDGWTPKDTLVSSDRFFKNWADLPQIYYAGGDTFALSWLEMSGDGTYDYDVKVAMSIDRGKIWSDPLIPHRDGIKGEHGFVSFFEFLGETGLIWLDCRAMADDNNSPLTGAMRLYASTINPNGKLGPEIILDDMVCECCPTSAVNTRAGPLVAYRDRGIDEVRNIQLTFVNFAKLSRPINEDGWIISVCPVNGPAMNANGDRIAIAWYTAPNNEPKVNVAFSKDGGLSFSSPIQVDNGFAIGRTDNLWLDDEKVLVSWLELGKKKGELVIKSINAEDGTILFQTSFSINSGWGSGYPKITKTKDFVFITWTKPGENGGIQSEWIPLSKIL